MTARFDARLMLSRHEGVHAIHNIEHHVEVARSTVEGEQTSRGYCVAHTIAKDDFADPFDRVVNSLVDPASDLHFFGQRWDYDTGDHCDAIKAARAIDGTATRTSFGVPKKQPPLSYEITSAKSSRSATVSTERVN
jgi:hypothetical protein